MMNNCVFCQKLANGNFFSENETCISFPDAFPVSKGHSLIVPKRHEGDFFNLNEDEQKDIISLLNLCKKELSEQFKPDGFNVGINVGEHAGQTVSHAHIHLMPRYKGDSKDPRGGIRWTIPGKANYWD
ncbi:HIT family protein [Dehalococcoidia bacterium]|nr:HIT family protein [Dehalococcoidia bacterium]